MNTEPIDISNLDKAEVLAALYNSSRQQGMGFMHSRGRDLMTVEQAREEIAEVKAWAERNAFSEAAKSRLYFDYLHGRVMKTEIGGDTLDPWGYDRDNGQGAAEAALRPLLEARSAAA